MDIAMRGMQAAIASEQDRLGVYATPDPGWLAHFCAAWWAMAADGSMPDEYLNDDTPLAR